LAKLWEVSHDEGSDVFGLPESSDEVQGDGEGEQSMLSIIVLLNILEDVAEEVRLDVSFELLLENHEDKVYQTPD
jgi:hypothetical protein